MQPRTCAVSVIEPEIMDRPVLTSRRAMMTIMVLFVGMSCFVSCSDTASDEDGTRSKAQLSASVLQVEPKANPMAEGLAAAQIFSKRVKERAEHLEQQSESFRAAPLDPLMADTVHDLIESLTLKSKTIYSTFLEERVHLDKIDLADGGKLVRLRIQGERPRAKFVVTFGRVLPSRSKDLVPALVAQSVMIELARSFVANFSKGSKVRQLWPSLEFVWVFGSTEGFDFLAALQATDDELWGVIDIGTGWPESFKAKQLLLAFDGKEGQDLCSRAAAAVGADMAGPGWSRVAYHRGEARISDDLLKKLGQEQVPLVRAMASHPRAPESPRKSAFAAPRRTYDEMPVPASSFPKQIKDSGAAGSWPTVMLGQFVASLLVRLSGSLAL